MGRPRKFPLDPVTEAIEESREDSRDRCEVCACWQRDYTLCRRYPQTVTKYAPEWCGEFRP